MLKPFLNRYGFFCTLLSVFAVIGANAQPGVQHSRLPSIYWQGGAVKFDLSEWLSNPAAVDSISAPKGLSVTRPDTAYHITMQGSLKLPVGILRLWSNGSCYATLVKDIRFKKSYCETLRLVDLSGSAVDLTPPPHGSKIMALWGDREFPRDSIYTTSRTLRLSLPPNIKESEGLSHLYIVAASDSCITNELVLPLVDGQPVENAANLPQSDFHKAVAYSLNVDRFYNGDKSNDFSLKVNKKVNFYGGDLAGVLEKMKEGFFDTLGVNTIILSPLLDQPGGAVGEFGYGNNSGPGLGWHGLWPVSNVDIEQRLGRVGDLDSLVSRAQKEGRWLFMKYPARNIYEGHHLLIDSLTGRADSLQWVTDSLLADSTVNVGRWEQHPLTTWKEAYLPCLNLADTAVASAMADSAAIWLDRYGLDGLIAGPQATVSALFWRKLAAKSAFRQGNAVPRLVSPTIGNGGAISTRLSQNQLDSYFDSRQYQLVVSTFMRDSLDMQKLANSLLASVHHYTGVPRFHFSGGYAYPRFASLAAGHLKLDEDLEKAGWVREIGEPDSASAYRKLAMLHALNFALPGVPVIYYGDEYGMPGAMAPDNSREMEFAGYSLKQKTLRNAVKKLARLRTQFMPLVYGSVKVMSRRYNTLMIERDYGSQAVLAVFNASAQRRLIELPTSDLEMENATALFDHSLEVSRDYAAIVLPPFTFDYIMVGH